MRIFLNTGSDAIPSFDSQSYLQVGGSDFQASQQAMPEIVDWNNDGKKDVLCGEINGKVYLLINTGTDASPVFSSSTFVKLGTGNLDAGSRSAPVAVDWDRDGRKDLIVGSTDGKIRYYRNVGTDAAPTFSTTTMLRDGGSDIDVGSYSRPDVADWDNDGIFDIICGSRDYSSAATSGAVWFFGGNVIPADEDEDDLKDEWEREQWGNITQHSGTGDADGDGQSNADEQNCGANPKDAASALRMGKPTPDSSPLFVTLQWHSFTGFSYRVQRSSNLLDGWTDMATGIQATPPVNSQRFFRASADYRFFRVQVETD